MFFPLMGGGDDVVIDLENISYGTRKWEFNAFAQKLADGYVLEVEWYYPEMAEGDYPNVIGIGYEISSWQYTNGVGIYVRYSPTAKFMVIRQAGQSTNCSYDLDFSVPHTIRIDKDYVYIDGDPVVATNVNATNRAYTVIGSYEGSNRYVGTYNRIKYFKEAS